MNVSLSPELERFVKKCVDNGCYTSASEVVRAALRELRPIEEARHFQRVDRLRAVVQKALNDQIYYQKLGTRPRTRNAESENP